MAIQVLRCQAGAAVVARPYPEVSLKEAGEKREELRKQVAAGTDPGEIRQITKLALVNNSGNTFEAIAREWHQMHSGAWNREYQATIIRRLEADAFPWIGSQPISSLKPLNVLAVLRRIQKRGTLETAHRMLQYVSKIMRHSVATGRADRDITADLRGALGDAHLPSKRLEEAFSLVGIDSKLSPLKQAVQRC